MSPGAGLLERGPQTTSITEALAAGRRGEGCVVLIEGPAGIGKSGLLQTLRQEADGRSRVLVARASRLEQTFAFGVVRQLFEQAVRDPAVVANPFEGAAGPAADVFEDAPIEGGAASYAILHGLYWLTLNLADEGPLVLVVDDLHWCDISSLRFLTYLARRLDGTHVVLAATTRPVGSEGSGPGVEQVSDLLAELLGDLAAEPSAVHLHPPPLSPDASTALLTSVLGRGPEPTFAAACFDATDGNPLLLTQLAHSLRSEATEPTDQNASAVRRTAHRALSRTVLARVGRLPATTVAAVRAIAILGETATTELVAALAGISTDDVVDAVHDLIGAQVLAREEALTFVHALVRDAVYFDLPSPERERLHARAARLLAEAGAPVERIASQLELVPPSGDPWAVEINVQAAEAAVGRAAPDAAASYLQRALAEPPPPALRAELAHRRGTLLVDVNGPSAGVALREAVDMEPDPLRAAAIEIELLQVLTFTGGQAESSRIARQRLEQMPPEAEDLIALYETFRANAVTFGAVDEAAIAALAPSRRWPLGDGGPGIRARASLASMMWMYDGRSADDAAALAKWAISGDQMLLRTQTMPAVGALITLSWADRDEPLTIWEDARDEAHRTGAALLHWTIDVWLGAEQQRRGNLGSAIELLRESAVIGRRWNAGGTQYAGSQFSEAPLALALLDQGELAAAREVIERSPPSPTDTMFSTQVWLYALAHVRLDEGRLDEALEATLQQERRTTWLRTPVGYDWRLPRAQALHRLGRQDEALAFAEGAVGLAERWGTPNVVGPALRVRGELRGPEGFADLRRSVDLLAGSSARLEYAKSLASLGAALRRERQPTEARDPLERAYELARACDAGGVVEAVRTELAASGVRRRRDEAGGAGALTPSERRVADLAAGGRTNREIAQELFVTPKTVEVHLSAAYRKLGITSRHALAGVLAG